MMQNRLLAILPFLHQEFILICIVETGEFGFLFDVLSQDERWVFVVPVWSCAGAFPVDDSRYTVRNQILERDRSWWVSANGRGKSVVQTQRFLD